MFRPSRPVDCFYCQSTISPPPKNPQNFRCPHCQCWNRYDAAGEIFSDEPAMHDPDLNARSFARRASPRKDRFLSSYANPIFCHTCQTNQMLLTNLLSNYLPSPDDPGYEKRLELLPEYQISIEQRYPPVCPSCLPVVEEEIRNRDHMARTNALGRWLNQSKGKQKQAASRSEDAKKLDRDLRLWKFRGFLWVILLCMSIAGHSSVCLFNYRILPYAMFPSRVIPITAILFFPATYLWNPTHAPIRRAKYQGRDLRLQGGTTYIICQTIVWFQRLLTCTVLVLSSTGPRWDYLYLAADNVSFRSRLYFSTASMVELFTHVFSFSVLKVHRPPTIRLIDSDRHRTSVPPPTKLSEKASIASSPPPETDLLASLTLSTKPIIRPNPIFGTPSLQHLPQTPVKAFDEDDPNAMDWTPTNPSPKKSVSAMEYGEESIVKQQHFFPPEEPTGLEHLLLRTTLVEISEAPNPPWSIRKLLKDVKWGYWICALVFIPAAAFTYYYLSVRRGFSPSIYDVAGVEPEIVE